MKIAIQTAPQPLEQMQLLFRLATAVSHTQDPAEIYRAAVEGLTQLLGADRAAVRVFDSDGVLRFKEWKGLSERFRTEVEPHSAWPQGLADAEPIVAADVQEEGPVSRYRPNFEREGIRAVAFIPLLANGGVVGEFTLYYDQPHEFSSEELQLAQMIGAHVAFTAERQNAAAVLRATEERFRVMFLQASVGIAQIGPDGEYLAVNDRYCAILGYTQAELQEKSPVDIEHPEDREVGRTIRRRFIAEGAPFYTRETRFIRKDESIIWAKLHISIARGKKGRPKYFVCVLEDQTEKIHAERALEESREAFALAQRAARLGSWCVDLRTNQTTYSEEYARLHGFAPGDRKLTHEEWLKLIHPDDRERIQAALDETHQHTRSWDNEFRVVWPDGSVHWLLGKGQVYLDNFGQPSRMAGVTIDVTERKQAEVALRESDERFRAIADSAPVMMWVASAERQFTFFNKTLLGFVGRTMEQEMNDHWVGSIHPDDVERCIRSFRSAFEAREPFEIHHRLRRADGEYRNVLCSGVPRFDPDGTFAGYIGSGIDITDLRRSQEEVFERQKLESLGVLTGGIAHDFNNLLGSILVNAELAESSAAAGEFSREPLGKIKTVAVRAAEIVRELMIYSGQDKAELGPVDVSQLVEEMLELLRISISKNAALQVHLTKNLPPVNANAAQIRQIVMNLLLNASEAIGENPGTIHVTTSFVESGRDRCVQLHVSDDGCGMTDEQQARIFDPFFTTKFSGRGLGLAVVQSIVRAHSGKIRVQSAISAGTVFEVLLPCGQATEPASQAQKPLVVANPTPNATVLVVEDEEELRGAVAQMLRKKGFLVLEAGTGTAAIELVRSGEHFDAMLLDLTIPGATSREVADEAHRTRPGVKLVLTSAYGESAAKNINVPEVAAFIRKPFQLVALVGLLQETLRLV